MFKCFIHQLSPDLDNAEAANAPELKNIKITHLFWADDLILLALDQDGLQQLLDILFSYCIDWGLTVNISKTAVMVFYRSRRSLLFKFADNNVASVREYCSLGISFTLSGSTMVAQGKLKQKGDCPRPTRKAPSLLPKVDSWGR